MRDDKVKLRHFKSAPALEALAGDGTVWFRDVDVTVGRFDDIRVLFATDKTADPIQRAHRSAAFYEAEELELLREHVAKGATFVDMGANVGNHTLFAALMLGARRVIPFEPNPLALRLLLLNVMMNGIEDRVVHDHLGLGLSDGEAEGFGMQERDKNLGAARMLAGKGDLRTIAADTALADETPDFIKIDVEGMEMLVLAGLSRTLAQHRPKMLIEVNKANYEAFDDWLKANDYTVLETIQRYANNRNFLVAPVGA